MFYFINSKIQSKNGYNHLIRITFIATIFALRVAFNLFPGVSATDIVVLHDPVVGTVEVTTSYRLHLVMVL